MRDMRWHDYWRPGRLTRVGGPSFWFSARPVRAIGEVLAVQIPLFLWALFFARNMPVGSLVRLGGTFFTIAGPGCILYSVFRMRRPARTWWRRLALYVVAGLVVGFMPSAMIEIVWVAHASGVRPRTVWSPPQWFFFVWLLAFTSSWVISRLGAWLLATWNGLRRKRLIWSLTNAHLMVVVLGSSLLCALLVVVQLMTSRFVPFQLVPVVFVMFLLTVFALLIVLPPSAIFSYVFAHRTTRRLELLADATNALRAGDYRIRVPVRGEDEVAQLQINFNAMAADLERAVRELHTERDRVATLLMARRELVASVSHELRTPVATLRGYLESTRAHWDGAQTPPDTLRHDLAIMERETLHLQALIDDLFTLSRADVGKLEMRPEPTDVAAVARRCVETLAPLAWQSNRVEVVAEVPEDGPLALADGSRLEQAIQNLLHNGVRHTAPGGIVAVEVTATTGAADNMLTVKVKDTGEGIAPDELPHIWERFYRTERSRQYPGSGTGLGLALVKELIETMGGSVAVESALGVGSCFTLRLPRAQAGATDRTSPIGERDGNRDAYSPKADGLRMR